MIELRVLRERQGIAQHDLDRSALLPPDGAAAVLAQTTTVAKYPTSASAFFACVPVDVDGIESEGTSASYSVDSSKVFYAYNIGTQAPPAGTILVCHSVGGRWCFRYDG